jgi:hypothetical protein
MGSGVPDGPPGLTAGPQPPRLSPKSWPEVAAAIGATAATGS